MLALFTDLDCGVAVNCGLQRYPIIGDQHHSSNIRLDVACVLHMSMIGCALYEHGFYWALSTIRNGISATLPMGNSMAPPPTIASSSTDIAYIVDTLGRSAYVHHNTPKVV